MSLGHGLPDYQLGPIEPMGGSSPKPSDKSYKPKQPKEKRASSPIHRKHGSGKQSDLVSTERVYEVIRQHLDLNKQYAVACYLGVEILRKMGRDAWVRKGKWTPHLYPHINRFYLLDIPREDTVEVEDWVYKRSVNEFSKLPEWGKVIERLKISSSAIEHHDITGWLETLTTYIRLNPRPVDLIWAWRKIRPQLQDPIFEKEINTLDHHLTPPWLEGDYEKVEQAIKNIKRKASSPIENPKAAWLQIIAGYINRHGLKKLSNVNHKPNVVEIQQTLGRIIDRTADLKLREHLLDISFLFSRGIWNTKDIMRIEDLVLELLNTAVIRLEGR